MPFKATLLIRDADPSDLARLLVINQAATPGVGSITLSELTRLYDLAVCTLVVERSEELAGFILCMTEGVDYASPNYRWISERYPQFAYCDRIAVCADNRGLGIGEALYDAACERLCRHRHVLTCEVNLAPPNPGSLKFHYRVGFRPVGERWSDDRSKGVVYLAKTLV